MGSFKQATNYKKLLTDQKKRTIPVSTLPFSPPYPFIIFQESQLLKLLNNCEKLLQVQRTLSFFLRTKSLAQVLKQALEHYTWKI